MYLMEPNNITVGTLPPSLKKKIVRIDWVDSNIAESQTYEIVEPVLIRTVGYCIHDSIEYITLARDLIDGEYRGQISIPKECIKGKKDVE